MKFYYAPGSCSFASHVALLETGAPFEAIRVVLANGDQRKPEYLAINPHGRVPALVTETGAITESIAILTYLARRFPEAGLLPWDRPAELARAYELMSWFASTVQVSFSQVFRGGRFSDDAQTLIELKAAGKPRVAEALAEMEDAAPVSGWLLGDEFSVADAYATVFWRWAPRLELDVSVYPKWGAHAARVLARASAVRALATETE